MMRKKGKLSLNKKEILGVILASLLVAGSWFTMGLFLGRASVPKLKMMDFTTHQWTEITPKANSKLFCINEDDFAPCGRVHAEGMPGAEDALGGMIIVTPYHEHSPSNDDGSQNQKNSFRHPAPLSNQGWDKVVD